MIVSSTMEMLKDQESALSILWCDAVVHLLATQWDALSATSVT
jgi:hypothetical protein